MQKKLWNKQTLLTLMGISTLFAGLAAFFYFEGLADKPIYLYAIIAVALIIITIIVVYLNLLSKGKIRQSEPDYRSLFYLGFMFFIFGSSDNPTFFFIGLAFIVVALANRKKWKPQVKWSEMDTKERNFKISAVAVLFLLVIGGFVMWFLGSRKVSQVNNFEECISAGNPAMESYPRQCRHKGITYIEEIKTDTPESWDQDTGKVRAAEMAMAPLSFPVTVTDVEYKGCGGCYLVTLKMKDSEEYFTMEFENWTIKEGLESKTVQ